jgi:hypothetical protein
MKIKFIFLLILYAIFLPMIIIGTLLMIVGRLIIALGYLFWIEPYLSKNELIELYDNIKCWIGL